MGSGNGNQIAAAAQKWPLDQQRLTQAVDIFNQNNWPKAARLIAEKNISIFSNSYMAWFAYLQLSDLTDAERVKAISQLHRLDPNNPEFK
jgi:threonine synthase